MALTPVPSAVPSLVASSAASGSSSMPASPRTPAPIDMTDDTADAEDTGAHDDKDHVLDAADPEMAARTARLTFLLEKSTIYAKIIGDRMERQQIDKAHAEARAATRRANKEKKDAAGTGRRGGMRDRATHDDATTTSKRPRRGDGGRSGKRAKMEGEDEAAQEPETEEPLEDEAAEEKPKVKEEDEEEPVELDTETIKQYSFAQPALITGATLRDYQLAGVQWMISLYENGLNGILADEMGLGKTLQTIAFLAHLRSKGTWGPFLIVCPLSVLHNWITEFEKFAPSIPVIQYHGTPDQRADIRRTRLQVPVGQDGGKLGKGTGGRGRKSLGAGANTTSTFPIVVTTYEICMKDRPYLSGIQWKYIVVDEGHRLKNLDCKLIRELKSYNSANRLILTGTPLHNNLAELWSLLNFILPDIFDDLESFQQWFNFDDLGNEGLLNKGSIVHQLHGILKPFLLRRLKVDVEKDLPPKKEYLLYAPLTQPQKDLYQAIVNRDIRDYLINLKTGGDTSASLAAVRDIKPKIVEEVVVDGKKVRRVKEDVNYAIEESDSKYFRDLEKKARNPDPTPSRDAAKLGLEWKITQATKQVNNMRLQNLVMQLRKVSSHPFLFDWPCNEDTGELQIDENLTHASGKMLLLNRLLDALFAKKHKVLIFSQFTTMLDVIQDWAEQYKGWKICRIDGSTNQANRRDQMKEFNEGGDNPEAPQLFLLSTRAGGLGINLVAADTVIFFDQDWNPQMDLQAQDRAHRIGQTKPVLVFRLVSAHTVETKILQKAGNKRKLEALVIQQGKFGKVVDENGRVLLGKEKRAHQSTAEMARALLDLEGEEINIATADDTIISDADLETLLDRSPAAFAREKGWSAGLGEVGTAQRGEQLAKGEKTLFEVFVPAKDEAADGLAHMFEGDGEAAQEE